MITVFCTLFIIDFNSPSASRVWSSTNDDGDDKDYKDELISSVLLHDTICGSSCFYEPGPPSPPTGTQQGTLRGWTSLCMTECADVSISF
jgi:hypothetical protein